MAERVLKKGMSIICRTEEEEQVFREFADKEGHRWVTGRSILTYKVCYAPCSFQIEYEAHNKFPDSISYGSINFNDVRITKIIEASELFRNQLISRRIKNGIS